MNDSDSDFCHNLSLAQWPTYLGDTGEKNGCIALSAFKGLYLSHHTGRRSIIPTNQIVIVNTPTRSAIENDRAEILSESLTQSCKQPYPQGFAPALIGNS